MRSHFDFFCAWEFRSDFSGKHLAAEKGRACVCGRARKVTDINRLVRVVIQTRHSSPVSFLGCLDCHKGLSFTMVSPRFQLGLAQVFEYLYVSLKF